MKETDLAWLAGLLEGEGSFLHGPPSEPNRIRVSLAMTDEDVVARAAVMLGVRYKKEPSRNDKWKPSYYLQVRGRRAARLMRQLHPLMGVRRRKKIEEVLRVFIERDSGHPRKLTENDVRAIRLTNPTIVSSEVLAKQYGVSGNLVRRVRRGEVWKHVV